MQNAPPPPTPMSPTSMDSMLRLDLSTLRTDSVLVYASRVAHLQPSNSVSNDKLRMLFVLSQKLVQWFISERRELERLNHTLQEELLEALRSADSKGIHADQTQREVVVSESAVPPPIICSQDAFVQTEVEENDRSSDPQLTQTDSDMQSGDSDCQATQTDVEVVDTSSQTEVDPVRDRLSCETQAVQTDTQAELVESTVQTDREEGPPNETQTTQTDAEVAEWVEASIQTEAAIEFVATSIQTDAPSSDSQASQTEIESVESSVQTEAAAECVDGGFQTDDVRVEAADTSSQTDLPAALVEVDIQTDAAAAVVESSVQTESWSEPIECGVQVTIEPEVTECGIQAIVQQEVTDCGTQAIVQPEVTECGVQAVTETELVDGCMQTLGVESTSVETQATPDLPGTAERAACTLDLISCVDESTETESMEEISVVTPPLETYFQVQRSVLMLQRIVRGFVTRRRFYRMLTELVNAK